MGKATREAYGNALAKIGKENSNIIVLDADLSKSTKTDTFKRNVPSVSLMLVLQSKISFL